jgi:hypothetical protein
MTVPWTLEQFATVEANPFLSDEQVARLLKGRSANAVGMVRIGLHAYHQNKDGNAAQMFLPKVIREYLRQDDRQRVTCARCGVKF